MDVKRALDEANGDAVKAREILKTKSATMVAKKAERATGQGLIHTYSHLGRIGAMVEVNCETDFVARNDDFKQFVKDLTLHIASMKPADMDELMAQPFFSDDSVTIRELLDRMVGKIGENIQIKRFARFELGEE
jgi:elongation factor Ts